MHRVTSNHSPRDVKSCRVRTCWSSNRAFSRTDSNMTTDMSDKQAQNLDLAENQLLETIHKDALSVLEEVVVNR